MTNQFTKFDRVLNSYYISLVECRMQEASISDRRLLSDIKLSAARFRAFIQFYTVKIKIRKVRKSKTLSVFVCFCIILTEEFHVSYRRRFMEQKTTLSQSIDIVEQKAQYDEACKKVLAEKIILAWIMKHTMKEYVDYDIAEIVGKFIVGDPKVAETKVMPDETNAPKIIGTGVEDTTVTEGSVTYDIQFRAIVPLSEEVVQMIINIEAQNDFYPGYPIIKRAVYYCTRMISSQYGTVFTKSHYEKVQKVYLVWICMNPPKERKNTITGLA